MKIITIFGQRKCEYDGEFAPELICAVDQYTNEENPQYLENELNKNDLSVFTFIKQIIINIPTSEFDKVFFSNNEVTGEIS